MVVTAAVRKAMIVAPIVGTPVVATVLAGVVVGAVVVVGVADYVPLVLPLALRAHAKLPLPTSMATVGELTGCPVQDARGVEEVLCAGLHAVIRTTAVKAITTVSLLAAPGGVVVLPTTPSVKWSRSRW